MKRHPALRDLSSDHHQSLVQAHRLQKADAANETALRVLADEFCAFFREHANPHFREEEEALLPFFARYGDVNQEPIRQMQREHILIRRDVALLLSASTRDAAALRALGKQLENHVRLEERAVFPLIEEALSEAALDELPRVLAAWQSEARGGAANE